MKILFTSYYGIRDGLLCASNGLKELGNEIYDFPLLKNKIEKKDYKEMMVSYILNKNIEVVLWWFITIDYDDMKYIINSTGIRNIYFNWDEPFNWVPCDLEKKAHLLDIVFVCSSEYLNRWIENGTREAYYLLPGFSRKINYILNDNGLANKYDCDVSFICTNLYENINEYPNQYINRKQLIDDIYNNQEKYGYKFNIYGPDFLKKNYEKSYKGYITYDEQNLLFNKSKINISTHVSCNNDKYLNERTVMIAGSGGLLLIDDIKNLKEIFVPNEDCLILDKNNYIGQIVNILNNYDNYIDMRCNIYNKSENYEWKKWAEFINSKIKK